MVELRPSYTAATYGRVDEGVRLVLMTVRNLTRDGQIKMVSDDRGGDGDYRGRSQTFNGMLHRTGRYWLLPAADWDVNRAQSIARTHTYPKSTTPMAWESLEDARTALAEARHP
jgi:hypothetical protein